MGTGVVGFGGFNDFAFNVEEFNAALEVTISWMQQQVFQPEVVEGLSPSQLAAISGNGIIFVPLQPFELVKVVGSDDTAILLQGEAGVIDGLVGLSFRERSTTGSVFPAIETVGSGAVQYALEGSVGLIKKTIIGESNRKVTLVGEHRPKRAV